MIEILHAHNVVLKAALAGFKDTDTRYADRNFAKCELAGANLRRADLSSADLSSADLRGADLWRADLRGANLRGANLYHANLRGANLHRADLRGANLSSADLHRADLRDADLYHADLRDADLADITMNWLSHGLVAERLRQAAGIDPILRLAAGYIAMSLDWCWDELLINAPDVEHPKHGSLELWALATMRTWIKDGDDDDVPDELKELEENDNA